MDSYNRKSRDFPTGDRRYSETATPRTQTLIAGYSFFTALLFPEPLHLFRSGSTPIERIFRLLVTYMMAFNQTYSSHMRVPSRAAQQPSQLVADISSAWSDDANDGSSNVQRISVPRGRLWDGFCFGAPKITTFSDSERTAHLANGLGYREPKVPKVVLQSLGAKSSTQCKPEANNHFRLQRPTPRRV